ncbi:MAG: class I SAM-dependent methyltransferase, partial [Planctomycetota bacterium]
MAESTKTTPDTPPDWDTIYREGVPPWETGLPSGELIRVLDEGIVSPGITLEVGCGTGADAVYLAQRGFEVTGVDSSPMAVERARARSRLENAAVCFALADVFEFVETAEPFDFIYDAGFYHFIRQTDLNRYFDLLWRTTRPGSYYLALTGSTGEAADGGPPQVSEEEIRSELGRLLEFVHLRHFRFESRRCEKGY